LGFEADPALMLSRRDHGILSALDARFISLSSVGPTKSPQTLALQCHDSGFIDWAKKNGVRGVLVRPDRFIAARLDAGVDLAVLNPFAMALTAALSPAPRPLTFYGQTHV